MLAHAMHGVAHLHSSDYVVLGAMLAVMTFSLFIQARRRRAR